MITKPKLLLQLEGVAAIAVACVLYHQSHGSWLWFAVLFLSPDLSMVAYAAGNKVGALFYNVVHTYILSACLVAIYWATGQPWFLWLGLISLAHIGMDRMLGFGLKYETAFKETHLHRV